MRTLYLVRGKDENLNSKLAKSLLENLSKKHKNLCIFCPVKSKDDSLFAELDSNFKLETVFDEQDALKSYVCDVSLFTQKLIASFEDLKQKYDFVFVLGLFNFGSLGTLELDVKFAKDFNSPIFAINPNKDSTVSFYLKEKLCGAPFVELDENFNSQDIKEIPQYDFLTPSRFSYKSVSLAKAKKKTVVLPESDDERILQAAHILLEQDIVNLILLGDEKEIIEKEKELKLNLSKAQIINNKTSELIKDFATKLYEARKHKGMQEDEALELIKDRTYFATMLVHAKKADAMVSGASTTTAETIRPALQFVKTKEGVSIVSGMFFMLLEDRVLVFADCAVATNPSPEQIAEIAYSSAKTAQAFDIKPKVALLSYSTGNSGSGISVDATKEALNIAKQRYKDLEIDGPLQFDAAIDEKTAKSKMPNSTVAGKANVFIFPDLNAANICYKAVQRTAKSLAIGPILQGLNKPINDLSRGCLVDDVVNTVILSAIQAD